MYCAYGHGARTERGYHYNHVQLPAAEGQCPAVEASSDITTEQVSTGGLWFVNNKAHDSAHDLEHGVQLGDGDGTVPLVSLGAMCAQGWRSATLNPHGVKVRHLSLQPSNASALAWRTALCRVQTEQCG